MPDTISIREGDTGRALSLGLSVSKAVSEAPAGFSLGYCCHPPPVPHWEELQEQG